MNTGAIRTDRKQWGGGSLPPVSSRRRCFSPGVSAGWKECIWKTTFCDIIIFSYCCILSLMKHNVNALSFLHCGLNICIYFPWFAFFFVCVLEREKKITVSYLIDVKTANHFPVSTLQFWQDESVGTGSGRGLSMQMDFRHILGDWRSDSNDSKKIKPWLSLVYDSNNLKSVGKKKGVSITRLYHMGWCRRVSLAQTKTRPQPSVIRLPPRFDSARFALS